MLYYRIHKLVHPIPHGGLVGGNLRHNKVASGSQRAGVGAGGLRAARSRDGMDISSHNAAAQCSPGFNTIRSRGGGAGYQQARDGHFQLLFGARGSDTITWLPLLWAACTLPPSSFPNAGRTFSEVCFRGSFKHQPDLVLLNIFPLEMRTAHKI